MHSPNADDEPPAAAPTPLVIVSNRLPMAWSVHDGWTRSPGGLVTALDAVSRSRSLIWFGHAGVDSPGVPPTWPHGELHPIRTDAAIARDAVDGLANSALWPALHGMRSQVTWLHEWWRAYEQYNVAFADAIAATSPAGAQVWVHDYHLLLLPRLLQERMPGTSVGLTLHTPFDGDTIARLPEAAQLGAGMEPAACIGAQTDDDRRSVTSFLDHHRSTGRAPLVMTSPVSIDPTSTAALLEQPVTRLMREHEASTTGERTLIVTVDRLDYTKGILDRMRGYDLAFRRGWMSPDDVRIVQVTQPTRTQVPGYRDLRIAVERLAHEINAHWAGGDDSGPIDAVVDSLDRRHVAALLAEADVCLVTPYRDGMNLVAKEFAILNEQHAGSLILSAGAGAAAELADGAIIIDAVDATSVADSLRRALSTDVEERVRAARRRADAVRRWTALDWADDFVTEFSRSSAVPMARRRR